MGAARRIDPTQPYVKKKNIINFTVATENTHIHLADGQSFPVLKGEIIATDQQGNQFVELEKNLDDYVPVAEKKKSSLYESMAQGYMEMGAINSEIAEAYYHVENEAESATTRLITGVYNNK
ncbi:hypothetical protein [Bacillus inaquosorum]|uniref:hypothetical protein n=1 Tax=Bacillus inaquosorum TaxID=483913 RepID=UPI0022826575|nr:hypothetical protein [Bacillus inaquosorum]MCY7902005.1 hypothetical protein [Bacillus inaquosorum]MCY8264667.1 hypothetical protein [Bacillus inaquosorum]